MHSYGTSSVTEFHLHFEFEHTTTSRGHASDVQTISEELVMVVIESGSIVDSHAAHTKQSRHTRTTGASFLRGHSTCGFTRVPKQSSARHILHIPLFRMLDATVPVRRFGFSCLRRDGPPSDDILNCSLLVPPFSLYVTRQLMFLNGTQMEC